MKKIHVTMDEINWHSNKLAESRNLFLHFTSHTLKICTKSGYRRGNELKNIPNTRHKKKTKDPKCSEFSFVHHFILHSMNKVSLLIYYIEARHYFHFEFERWHPIRLLPLALFPPNWTERNEKKRIKWNKKKKR